MELNENPLRLCGFLGPTKKLVEMCTKEYYVPKWIRNLEK
jgi:hypothetical protein